MTSTMIFTSLIVLAAGAAAGVTGTSPASHGYAHCRPDINTPEYHAHIVSNYLHLWGGRLDLLDQTISANLEFQSDSFPLSTDCSSGAGARAPDIHTSADFGAFVSGTRVNFAEYSLDNDLSFGQENNVVVRWTLRAVIGQNFTVLPTTLKPGDPFTYNGTDMLVLNKCTGLADKIFEAQDLITFSQNLGLKGVTV